MTKKFILSILILSNAMSLYPDNSKLSDTMFLNPPSEYRPKTMMFAMTGNMSKEGMTKDIEALSKAGIGGFLLFNIAQGIPYGNIVYNSSEYHEILKHAAKECSKYGITFGVHNCDGWSSSGGTWIKPENSMKYLVYRQSVVDGGKLNIKLPQPTSSMDFYRDVAVLAYPALEADIIDNEIKPVITSSDKTLDLKRISDYRDDIKLVLHKDGKHHGIVTFDYGKPFPARSIYISNTHPACKIDLEYSNDGVNYKLIKHVSRSRTGKKTCIYTDNFKTPNARFYRIVAYDDVTIHDVYLSSLVKLDDYIYKSALARKEGVRMKDPSEIGKDMTIKKESILNLTKYFNSESGILSASLPKGKWTIMRIGFSTTRAYNFPASKSGEGLECDKLDANAIELHFNTFVKKVADNAKSVAPGVMLYSEIDSYEMGGQNWTYNFDTQFKKKFGYDIIPLLPVVFGKNIDSVEKSDLFLADFREMISYLMQNNYYKRFAELCHENGLKYYNEPYGFGPFNYLDCGGCCDIPMGEFWMNSETKSDFRNAVSAGHIYGKNVISAESFTSMPGINWKATPAMAKPSGDYAWTMGINNFMFHRYAHQANTHVRPGMTMNKWGFHFDRNQTWWYGAGKEWFEYIRRGNYLLQQGVPVIDLLYYVGDETPNEVEKIALEFDGYKYDGVNSDVLLNRIKVKDNQMVLPEGITYKALILDNNRRMKLSTIRRIYELVNEGVPVIGNIPDRLSGYSSSDKEIKEFQELREKILLSRNHYENGEFNKLVKDINLIPDCDVNNGKLANRFYHRHLKNGSDIYFVYNPDSTANELEYKFRVTGKIPELWNAIDGKTRKSDNFSIGKTYTSVRINLQAGESMFIVFRQPADVLSASPSKKLYKYETLDLSKDWKVSFMKEYGFGATVDFKQLTDWSKSDNDNVKYYSGTASYQKELVLSKEQVGSASKIIMDLGNVEMSAEVTINNKRIALLWMPPYTLDVTEYLKEGTNNITISVTNQWTNRLIGDERYPRQNGGYRIEGLVPEGKMPEWYTDNKPMPAGPRITFCAGQFYKKDSPLIPAGLIGPVKLSFFK